MTFISWSIDFALYHCHRRKLFLYIMKLHWPGVFVPLRALALVLTYPQHSGEWYRTIWYRTNGPLVMEKMMSIFSELLWIQSSSNLQVTRTDINSLDGFEFRPDLTNHFGVPCPWVVKKMMSPAFLTHLWSDICQNCRHKSLNELEFEPDQFIYFGVILPWVWNFISPAWSQVRDCCPLGLLVGFVMWELISYSHFLFNNLYTAYKTCSLKYFRLSWGNGCRLEMLYYRWSSSTCRPR